jgi:hypothetical protein
MSMKPMVRSTAVALAATALGAATVAAPASAAPAHRSPAVQAKAISCSTSASGKPATFYSGPSASKVYDSRFSAGPAVPGLSTYTPQGVAAWNNWDGHGHNLLLVTAYRSGARSKVYGIDAATGKLVQTVQIAETHAGGIAVGGGWIFISGAGQSIRKYSPATMRSALQHTGSPVYVASVGPTRAVHGASFMSYYDGYVYSGLFNDSARDKMYRYKVASDGTLTTGTSYQVPTKTQGLVVTGTQFIFSTSYGRSNRGNLYVVNRGYSSLDTAKLYCFRSPSMNEGAALYGSTVYVVFESGSYEYRAGALNPITKLHRAPLSSLSGLV